MNGTYENYAFYRDLKNLSDYKVSNLTGIGKSTLSDWKNGKHQPKSSTLKKLAELLDVEVNAFYNSVPNILTDDNEKFKRILLQPYNALSNSISRYVIKIGKDAYVELTPAEYDELSEDIDIYIKTWVSSRMKNNKVDSSAPED